MMQRQSQRPNVIVWAVALNVIDAIGGFIFSVTWPDLEDRATVVTVSAVLGILLIATAWFLASGSRWGAIANLALNAFNILLGLPGFFNLDNAGEFVLLAISIVLSVAVIALVLHPDARAFWNRREAIVTR